MVVNGNWRTATHVHDELSVARQRRESEHLGGYNYGDASGAGSDDQLVWLLI